jgi:hypothetical protein
MNAMAPTQKARIDALLPQLHEAEERLHHAVEEYGQMPFETCVGA